MPAVTEVMAAKTDGTTFLMDNIASSAMLETVVKNLPYSVFDRTFVACIVTCASTGTAATTPTLCAEAIEVPFPCEGS